MIEWDDKETEKRVEKIARKIKDLRTSTLSPIRWVHLSHIAEKGRTTEGV